MKIINQLKESDLPKNEFLFLELKKEANKLAKRAQHAENRLKQIQKFTDSYHSLTYSSCSVSNMTSPFDSMMSMLGDMYQNEDMNGTIKIYNNFKDSSCHFAFFYANPLVIFKHTIHGDQLQPLVWDIDYKKDLDHVKETLNSLSCDINFVSSIASVHTFPLILSKNPIIVHFCGHGVRK